jgi:hypothetical protein
VLLVPEESMLILSLLLMALVIIVMWLAQPALEELILSARSVMVLFLLWIMEQNAEECVYLVSSGEHQTIAVRLVQLPV